MQIGDVTIVPFVDISFAVGTGGGSGVEKKVIKALVVVQELLILISLKIYKII